MLSSDGKFCVRCGTYVHLACETRGNCDVCGQPFQEYEPAKTDLMRDAILPRNLRESRSTSPMGAVLIMGIMLIVVVIIYAIINSAMTASRGF